ncbi:MAG: Kelch repeat-containing protein, partial [Tepidiformaceae bacterium]
MPGVRDIEAAAVRPVTVRLAGALLAAMILVACGGGGDQDPEETPTVAATPALTTTTTTTASGEPGASPSPEAGAGTWETLPPLAAGIRQETAVVTLGDEIVVIGGFGSNNAAQTRVEAYNPATRQWRDLPDLPVGMHHTNAAVVDGSIYIVGFLTGGNFAPDGRVFVLRPGADSWGAGALMPAGTQRGASATVAIGRRIYVAGGLRGGAVADFAVYDTATDTWSE